MITYHFLCEKPEHLEAIAKWHFEAWGKKEGDTIEDRVYRLNHALGKDKIPCTIIALDGNILCGTVSVTPIDHPGRQDVGPWLSLLFVPKNYRNKGIGKALVLEAEKAVKVAGFNSLFLQTTLDDFYEKLDWKVFESDVPAGIYGKATLYRKCL